jgi:nucleoside-diphosphate-sugar epimerase
MKVVITGANSAVGRAILRARSAQEYPLASARLVGLVRSDRAAESLRELLAPDREIVRISYNNPVSLCAALKEAAAVIHLPGVLVERAGSTYEEANVETTRSVVEAAKQSGVRK